MRVVLQKVNHAAVSIDDEVVGKIGLGYFLLVGFAPDDTEEKLDYLVHKITNLRVFEDENGKMNKGLRDVNGAILSVSQFTLYADTKHGNRPGFSQAARPEIAESRSKIWIPDHSGDERKERRNIFAERRDIISGTLSAGR